MNLESLPGAGLKPWGPGTSYVIYDTEWVGRVAVVLGRQTMGDRECDWFIGVYDHDGQRIDGSGGVTTANVTRAREYFDRFVARRRFG